MGNQMDDIQKLVELNGDKVNQGTAECKEWKSSHENCFGCQYELGCTKTVKLGLTVLASNEVIDRILFAKTVAELKSIHIPEMAY